MLLGPTGRIQF